MAHPEGMKEIMAASKSDMVSPYTTNNTVMTAKKPRKRSALRIRNMRLKSVPILCLFKDTIWLAYKKFLQSAEDKCINIAEMWTNFNCTMAIMV